MSVRVIVVGLLTVCVLSPSRATAQDIKLDELMARTAARGPEPAIGGRSIVETGRSVERNTAPCATVEQEIKRMSESAHRWAAAHETLTAVSVC